MEALFPGLVNKGVQMTDKVLGEGEGGAVYEVRPTGNPVAPHATTTRASTNN